MQPTGLIALGGLSEAAGARLAVGRVPAPSN